MSDYQSPFRGDTIRQQLAEKTLDELADWMAGITPGTPNELMAQAEFKRRDTLLQQEAAEAAKEAAQATKDTVTYTRANARSMLWSVIVLAVSSLVNTLLTIFHR